jgi:hypothetical protein
MCLQPRLRIAGFALTLLLLVGWGFSPNRAQSGGFHPAAQIKSGVISFPGPGEELERLPVVHLDTNIRTAQEARTWLRLLETPSVAFPKETALEDVLKSVRAALQGRQKGEAGVPIYVDPVALQEAEHSLKSPVEWNQEGVPMATALRLMLDQVGLAYRVTLDGLVIIYCQGNEEERGDVSSLILDNLSLLRSEVLALRREVDTLRHSELPGSTGTQKEKP